MLYGFTYIQFILLFFRFNSMFRSTLSLSLFRGKSIYYLLFIYVFILYLLRIRFVILLNDLLFLLPIYISLSLVKD